MVYFRLLSVSCLIVLAILFLYFTSDANGQGTSFDVYGLLANDGSGGTIVSEWTTGSLGNTWAESEWVPYQLIIGNVQSDYPGLLNFPDIVIEYDFTAQNDVRFIDLIRSIQAGTLQLTNDQGWPQDDGLAYPMLTRAEIEDAQNDIGNTAPLDNTWMDFNLLNLPNSQINRSAPPQFADGTPTDQMRYCYITKQDLINAGIPTTANTIIIYWQLHESRSFVWINSLQEQYNSFPTNNWGGYLYALTSFANDFRQGSGYVLGSSGNLVTSLEGSNPKSVPIPIPERLPGSISGLKWQDQDGDGIQDPDELVLDGWRIYLSGSIENIIFQASTLTAGGGGYSFPNLTSNVTWNVYEDAGREITFEYNYIQTYPIPGTVLGVGEGIAHNNSSFGPYAWEVSLTSESFDQSSMNFGNQQCQLVIFCPSDVITNTNLMLDFGTAIPTDNCDSDPSIVFSDDTTSSYCPTEINRTWTATDNYGNEDFCVQNIIIECWPPVFTIDEWGSECPESELGNMSSTHPGCIRDHYFSQVFPTGEITIGYGTGYSAHWTSSFSVKSYLPDSYQPGILWGNLMDPFSTPAGILGSQILALRLNREFSCAGIFYNLGLAISPDCYGSLTIPEGIGKFTGLTIDEFLLLADKVISGQISLLDAYDATINDLNYSAACLNGWFCHDFSGVYCEDFESYVSTSDQTFLENWTQSNSNGYGNSELTIGGYSGKGVALSIFGADYQKISSTQSFPFVRTVECHVVNLDFGTSNDGTTPWYGASFIPYYNPNTGDQVYMQYRPTENVFRLYYTGYPDQYHTCGPSVEIPEGKWYRMKVTLTENTISAYYDYKNGYELICEMPHDLPIVDGALQLGQQGFDPAEAIFDNIKISEVEIGPHLEISPSSFTFDAVYGGGLPASQTLAITNTGGGTLDWYVDEQIQWLDLDVLQGTSNTAEITISINTTGLAPGTYTGQMTISSTNADNSPLHIPVSYEIAFQPTCAEFAGLFCDDFTIEPSALWVTLTGSQPGSCTWSITNGSYGTNQTGTDQLCLQSVLNPDWADYIFEYDVRGNAGVDKEVTFRSQDGLNTYDVNLVGDPINELHLNKVVAGTSTRLATAPFSSQTGQWYHVAISAHGSTYSVSVDDQQLLEYTDNDNPFLNGGIGLVSWTGGAGINDISFDNVKVAAIEDPPHIVLTPSSLSFTAVQGGALPAPQILTITNTGGGTLDWYADEQIPWLDLDVWQGTSDYAEITASINDANLTPGSYEGTIDVSSNNADNSPQSVFISYNLVDDFYFVHITDTHYGLRGAREKVIELLNLIVSWDPKPAFVVVTGDLLTWGWCSDQLSCASLFFPFNLIWYEPFDNNYDTFKTDFEILENHGVPYYVCPGNHDYAAFPYLMANLDKFEQAFDVDYDIRYGNLCIVLANSGEDDLTINTFSPPRASGLTSNQLEWIETLFDGLDGDPTNGIDNSNTQKVLMCHHPVISFQKWAKCLPTEEGPYIICSNRWDAGVLSDPSKAELLRICGQYDVDAVCAGHTHEGRVYDQTMDGGESKCDRGGYERIFGSSGCPPVSFPLSSETQTLYEYTGAACDGFYRIIRVYSNHVNIENQQIVHSCGKGYGGGGGGSWKSGMELPSSPITIHAYDQGGNHVGRVSDSLEFNIEGAVYSLLPIGELIDPDSLMASQSIETITAPTDFGGLRFEIHGELDGVAFFGVENTSQDGRLIKAFYDSIFVTENSIGKVFVGQDTLDYIMYMDDDGDGSIDREIIPSSLYGINYVCGSANSDQVVNIADAVYVINYVFKGGPAPQPMDAGDANCDYTVNVSDAVYLINYVFKGGPEPCCP